MSRPVALWALSPTNCQVHLLAPGGQDGTSGLTARCGASLAAAAIQHDQPPPVEPCEGCSRIYLEEISGTCVPTSGVLR
ncbi:MAG: hypothetical protein ACRDRO_11635 [Pseudonocardiaceae bacterium]